jgi:hypothetical protein
MYMESITLLGLSIIILYVLSQILKFFGIDQETYAPYFLFFIFLVITTFVLPKNYPEV